MLRDGHPIPDEELILVPEEGSDVAVLSSLVVVLVLVLVFTIPAFVIYKRRRRVSSTSFLRVDPAS
ncbi:hypothetical protein COCON_G00145310 [Conger conger]|uniref:Uncharacterized protein n=1 Tax=Conger conger TaxID=82655 RepID=A0A9Q1DBF6_CONCO|nr:hypothetical protein COCON_G00145310 [Conger conger]